MFLLVSRQSKTGFRNLLEISNADDENKILLEIESGSQ